MCALSDVYLKDSFIIQLNDTCLAFSTPYMFTYLQSNPLIASYATLISHFQTLSFQLQERQESLNNKNVFVLFVLLEKLIGKGRIYHEVVNIK